MLVRWSGNLLSFENGTTGLFWGWKMSPAKAMTFPPKGSDRYAKLGDLCGR